MKTNVLAAFLAAILPWCVHADAPSPAAELAVPYRSVFDGLPRGVEEGSVDWKAANAAVAQFPRGHADLLKWERAQQARGVPAGAAAGSAASNPPGAPAPTTPGASAAPAHHPH